MIALQISPKINYKDLYGILQLLDNFPLNSVKLGWVAFQSLTIQLT